MTMAYSCIRFPLQLLGEDTRGKKDKWEEGRGSQSAPGVTSSRRCCFCVSSWREVEERSRSLLSRGGIGAEGLK